MAKTELIGIFYVRDTVEIFIQNIANIFGHDGDLSLYASAELEKTNHKLTKS